MLVARNKIEGVKATNFGQYDVLSAVCFLYLLTIRNSIGESVEGATIDVTSFRSIWPCFPQLLDEELNSLVLYMVMVMLNL